MSIRIRQNYYDDSNHYCNRNFVGPICQEHVERDNFIWKTEGYVP